MLTMVLLAAALQAAPAAPPERKICRRDVATGSITPKRTCRTRSEWAQIDAATAAMTGDTLRQRSNAPASLPH